MTGDRDLTSFFLNYTYLKIYIFILNVLDIHMYMYMHTTHIIHKETGCLGWLTGLFLDLQFHSIEMHVYILIIPNITIV